MNRNITDGKITKRPLQHSPPPSPDSSRHKVPMSVLRAILETMQFTLHAPRRTPHGASRLVQAISAWLVKPRRAPSRHSRDARVYGHTTTAMHKLSTISPPHPPHPLLPPSPTHPKHASADAPPSSNKSNPLMYLPKYWRRTACSGIGFVGYFSRSTSSG